MERNTPFRQSIELVLHVAANTKVEAGTIAAINAGYVEPGTENANIIYMGRFEETVDNTGGAAGDKLVKVRTCLTFQWKNSGTDPVVQADVGKVCYIEDDITVSKTDNSSARSSAGIILGVDSLGVWVAKIL